jgi:hypothetical protein
MRSDPMESAHGSVLADDLLCITRNFADNGLFTRDSHILKRDCAVSAADQREGTEHDEKRSRHSRSCVAIDQRINQSRRFKFGE